MSTKKFPVPLSYFSMPLGLFALGLSWRYGVRIGLLPTWAAETLLAAAFVLWLLLVIAYIIKIRFFRPEFLQDLQDLVQCCFISAIPITAMLAGLAALPYQTLLAKGLILLGTEGFKLEKELNELHEEQGRLNILLGDENEKRKY